MNSFSLLVKPVKPLTAVLLVSFSAGTTTWAQDCTTQNAAVTSFRSRIKADQDSIRRLNPALTADELNTWADATEQERQAILKKSLDSAINTLVDGVLDAPNNALKPMDIAGYHLPNGIASLGTGQANAIIGNLQRSGVSQTVKGKVVINSLRELSSISSKQGTLQFLDQLAKTAKNLKGASEVQNSDDSVEAAGALLQLVADLAGKGDFAAVLGTSLFQGAKNEFDAFFISSAVGNLANTSNFQLDAVKSLSAKIQRDVLSLKEATSKLESCGKAGKLVAIPKSGLQPDKPAVAEVDRELKRLFALVIEEDRAIQKLHGDQNNLVKEERACSTKCGNRPSPFGPAPAWEACVKNCSDTFRGLIAAAAKTREAQWMECATNVGSMQVLYRKRSELTSRWPNENFGPAPNTSFSEYLGDRLAPICE